MISFFSCMFSMLFKYIDIDSRIKNERFLPVLSTASSSLFSNSSGSDTAIMNSPLNL